MNIRKFKWILAFAGAVVVVLLLRGFAFTSCLIPSTGMENSIFQGERILVNKWSYGLRVPFMSLFSYHRWCESPVRRQDIVVFNNPAECCLVTHGKTGLIVKNPEEFGAAIECLANNPGERRRIALDAATMDLPVRGKVKCDL